MHRCRTVVRVRRNSGCVLRSGASLRLGNSASAAYVLVAGATDQSFTGSYRCDAGSYSCDAVTTSAVCAHVTIQMAIQTQMIDGNGRLGG
jgi:hypothetical protein